MSKQLSPKHELLIGQSATGRIGIFWWHDGRLLASICRVDEGEVADGAVDSRFAHVTTWPFLKKQHPKLRALEYDDVPRGRVIYLKPSKKFRVLMDKVLFRHHIKAAILTRFSLAKSRTSFMKDQHYTTDLKDLDCLFGDD